jgi:hypothetical protein
VVVCAANTYTGTVQKLRSHNCTLLYSISCVTVRYVGISFSEERARKRHMLHGLIPDTLVAKLSITKLHHLLWDLIITLLTVLISQEESYKYVIILAVIK